MKEAVPLISNAMLIGDRRKFLSMLLTVKVSLDAVGVELGSSLPPVVTLPWCLLQMCSISEVVSDSSGSKCQGDKVVSFPSVKTV